MAQFEGVTVDAAIANGLSELKLTKAEASIEVIRPASRGFLGIGKKTALVEVVISPEVKAKKQQVNEQKMQQHMRADAANDPQKSVVKAAASTATTKAATAVATKPAKAKKVAETPRSDEQAVKDLAVYLTDLTKRLGAPSLVRVEQKPQEIIFHLDTAKEGLLIGKHGRSINSLQYLSQTFFNHRGRTHQIIVLNVGDYRERRDRALTALAKRTARDVIADHQAVYLDPMPSFERKLIHTLLADSPYVETFSEGNDPDRYVVIAPRKTVKLP
ncbi:RNA-binding cell elongation regulator Jag/EloR [Lapidilactobacillus wuchangensis]|uniref:RNA-binding cell elongation regulator Jag/EloR n=1 Tax=Lapidilactobacillus wuchangensis TaxID=2486001 RepID=UPI000F7A821E|nr:RNA-binding cell elongation regulator Jag/EloR [Lapidilactobacillus wuchangensis]